MKALPICETPGCGKPYRGSNTPAMGRFCARCTLERRRLGNGNFATFHRSRKRR
jgi:hypothetical protein